MPALLSRKASPSTTFLSALQSLLTDEFDQVYAQCGADSAVRQKACIQAMQDLRQDVLLRLDVIHSDQRQRLARNVRVNQLPTNVLMQIFSYFSTTELVTLTHVCHYWRIHALGTPKLWATIELEGDCASALRELLPRSKATPVDLLLTRYSDREWRAAPVLRAVGLYMDRLHQLSIRPPPRWTAAGGWYSPMSVLSIGEMPPLPVTLALCEPSRLQTLDIAWDRLRDGELTLTLRTSTSLANECLQYVSLRGVTYQLSLFKLCTSLRSLELEPLLNCTVADILPIVKSNPLLQNLALYRLPFSRDPRRRWVQEGPVVQNGIEMLTLSAEHAVVGELDMLLLRLDSPAIRSAVLHIESTVRAHSVALIQASLAHLETIHFLDLHYSRAHVALLRVEDARGFQRTFTRQYADGLLAPLRPRLDYSLRALRVATREWVSAANASPGVHLHALEELHLVGSVLDFRTRQRSVYCPRLVTVVMELEDAPAPSLPVSSDTHWTLAAAIVAVRLHGCPRPLRELVIVDPDAALGTYNTAHTGLFLQLVCIQRARFPSARLTDRPFDDISNDEIANAV